MEIAVRKEIIFSPGIRWMCLFDILDVEREEKCDCMYLWCWSKTLQIGNPS
jgi:hypothetical protein